MVDDFETRKKWAVRVLDVLFIMALLSNFGALIITNLMIVKDKPTVQFVETNPAVEQIYGFEGPPPEQRHSANTKLIGFLIHALLVGAVIGSYVYARSKIARNKDLLILCIQVGVIFFLMFSDFTNDLGFLIGRILWGG